MGSKRTKTWPEITIKLPLHAPHWLLGASGHTEFLGAETRWKQPQMTTHAICD